MKVVLLVSKEDWKDKIVVCTDPVETDMFMGNEYKVERDYGSDIKVTIAGLARLYRKDRFEVKEDNKNT